MRLNVGRNKLRVIPGRLFGFRNGERYISTRRWTPTIRAHGVVGYHARLAYDWIARGVGFNSQCVHIFSCAFLLRSIKNFIRTCYIYYHDVLMFCAIFIFLPFHFSISESSKRKMLTKFPFSTLGYIELYAHRYKIQLEYQKFVYYVVNANWIIYYKYSMVKKGQPSILSHYTFVERKEKKGMAK